MPTKVFCGKNALIDNYNELKLGKRALVISGKSSGRASGALTDIENALGLLGIEYLLYEKISNNPTVEECLEGGKVARDFGADFLIGVGGGSPLDATKAIAVYATNEAVEGSGFEMMDIFKCDFENKPLPMAAIPTTSGTGSEVTPYSVLTLHSERTKRSFSTKDTFYKVAFVDGKYILNLPETVLKNTVVDAISHLIEGYTNKRSSPMSDYIALEGLEIIGGSKEALYSGALDEESANELMRASTLAGVVIAQTGTTIVHSMGYPLTYYKDIPHGRANGLLLAEYLRECEGVVPYKVKRILSALKLSGVDDFEGFIDSILETKEDFDEEEIELWLKTTVKAKNALISPFEASVEKERKIYTSSLLTKKRKT